MKKFKIGILITSIIFALSSLSINKDVKNNIIESSYANKSNISSNLVQAAAVSNSKEWLKHIGIIKLYNGSYIIVLHNIQESDLIDEIRNSEENQGNEEPKNIEIIKPIDRTTVNEDFKLEDINQNNNANENDPGYKYEWYIPYTQADKAWPLINQKREVKVAVLDTGIDYTHPDLRNRVDIEDGYNFVDNNYDTMDDNGHGTHISGIISAQANNGIGLVGITGNLDVKILPVKVLDESGYGDTINIVKGIIYAVDSGADIINLSLGVQAKSELIAKAIEYAKSKGVFVVAAAGNDDENSDNFSPAGDGAFTVAAMDYNYRKAYFSDYGNSIKVAAPGVQILSTVPGGYEAWDGTSMAAPVVSGIAAMLKAENPQLSPSQIEDIIDSTATDIIYQGRDQFSGYGLINAYDAIKKAKEMEN
ncbi:MULTISPECIES: S8 family peptidase [unclassified Clostridium]|uniref:S8 family peptidase n=1 Tax=unclassified Clostridium TaxID=2614128 RepID=UPI00029834E9|nr:MULTISPECIES: S8 family peptidase [unclassified Clostridium]EKQ51881.1 MAG: subtilisin-like serine protease [Clostridium sp. Maddingley MBC34-26]